MWNAIVTAWKNYWKIMAEGAVMMEDGQAN